MLIAIQDASKIFKAHETSLREKIRNKSIQPIQIQAKAKENMSKGYIECKVNLYDYDEIRMLVY